jgi:peptidoglycan hydrolase CwlO-like protein
MKKASLRQNIKRVNNEITQMKQEIEKEKTQQDEDMAGYLTLCYDGIDSDYSKIFVDILDSQKKTEMKADKMQKKVKSLNKFMEQLKTLCPEDPLLNNQK